METKLNSLRDLIEKVLVRIDKASESYSISSIEIDLILDLLRQAYVASEDLRYKGTSNESHKAPVVQVIQPPQVETQPKEIWTNPVAEPAKKPVEPVQEVVFENKPVEPVQEEPEVIKPVPVSIDEVPTMSFPKVEISNIPLTSEETKLTTPPASESFISPAQPAAAFKSPEPTKIETPAARPAGTSRQTSDLFGSQTLADKLKNETPSLNERITQGYSDQSLAHKMQLKPISDLRTAIGINEKFQFVNDLFEGRIELYNDAITNLNNCNSGMVADNILFDLKAKHNWNENIEAYNKLKNFVARRYI